MDDDGSIEIAYGLDEQPPPLKAALLGLQHVAVMVVPATAVAYIVAGAVGASAADTAYLVQMVLLFSGVATLIQTYGAGPIGAKLPIVMGTSFTFVGAATAIGAESGLPTVFGAVLVAGFLVEGLIGWQFERIRPYFPPLVTGLVVVIIGLYLVPVGMDYAAGGVGASDYGALHNVGLAALVLAVSVGLNIYGEGVTRLLSTLVGIAVGYVVAIGTGMVDFSVIGAAAWVALPQPTRFGVPTFDPAAILTFAFLFLVSAMETVGDMSGVTAAEGRNPTHEEFRGGLFTDGLLSSVGAVFGAFPVTSFSQNVGIVSFTGVLSRYVVMVAGGILVLLGFSPKVGAAVTTIPAPVFGGAVLLMAGMVAASGIRLVEQNTKLNRRNMVVIGVSLGLGLGVATRPEAVSGIPGPAGTFLSQPVILTALSALLLNAVAPGKTSPLFDVPEKPPTGPDPTGAVEDDD